MHRGFLALLPHPIRGNCLLVMDSPTLRGNVSAVWDTDSHFDANARQQLDLEHSQLMLDTFFREVFVPICGLGFSAKNMDGDRAGKELLALQQQGTSFAQGF